MKRCSGAVPLTLGSLSAGALESDEYDLKVESGSIGLELEEVSRYVNVGSRTQVRRLIAGSAAEKAGTVSAGDILVSVNGRLLETSDIKTVYAVISNAPRPVMLTLRKPGRFNEMLEAREVPAAPYDPEVDLNVFRQSSTVTTQVAPAYTGRGGTDMAQVVSVERENHECVRGAGRGDLLEVTYTGRLKADGTIFDGSAVTVNGRDQAGRGGDSSISFVLGQQPAGQFPPAFDVSLRGMCNGETRTITVPPLLGYGEKGLPRRRIPPNAELVYSVKLLSTNGDAQPGRQAAETVSDSDYLAGPK